MFVERAVLEEILADNYKIAHQKLMESKQALPKEYQGFIDEHMKSLKKVHADLKRDLDFYLFKDGGEAEIIKSFKIHCAENFLRILVVTDPKHILSYGITYDQFIAPRKKER